MKTRPTLTTLATLCMGLGALLPLSSCAYMQVHKRALEVGRSYSGVELEPAQLTLCRSAGQYYLLLRQLALKKHYPLINDPVFRENDKPTFIPEEGAHTALSLSYFRISNATAAILQNPQGYVTAKALEQDILAHGAKPQRLQKPQRCQVRAQIPSKQALYLVADPKGTPSTPTARARGLSALSYGVDIPGTVGYNLLVPFL